MTNIKDELEGHSPEQIEQLLLQLVEKFKLLEEYATYAMELLNLGHFAYAADQEVLSVRSNQSTEDLQKSVTDVERKLMAWQTAVEDARSAHYFLNYFTVKELCFLARNIDNTAEWSTSVWPLLRVVDPNSVEADMRKAISLNSNTKFGSTTRKRGHTDVDHSAVLSMLRARKQSSLTVK
jgi:hypothetical protein